MTTTAPKAKTAKRSLELRLYRVWRNTAGDESAHEIVVMASSIEDAEEKARAHVKSTNPSSGKRSKADSQNLTTILSVKRVGDKHCLEISTVPLAALQAIPKKAINAAIEAVESKKATRASAKSAKAPAEQ